MHTHTLYSVATSPPYFISLQVKSEGGEEGGMELHDQVITGLRQRLEDMQESLDCLQQSDHNLRLSLRLAEQRAKEAEVKLTHATER